MGQNRYLALLMSKKLIILILFWGTGTFAISAQISRPALLRDGFVLQGADGKLIGPDSNDVYLFELASDITDNSVTVKASTKLELLPSSKLEAIVAHSKTYLPATYQLLNGRVTRYKGRNYIFLSYFLPISLEKEKSDPNEIQPDKTAKKKTTVGDANDPFAFPPEVEEKLNAAREEMTKTGRRITDSNIVTIEKAQLSAERAKTLNTDSILVDRNAILIRRSETSFEFTLDSIGRNVQQMSFRLLPCEALERTEHVQSAGTELIRFKMSGIVTQYKGDNYILLQKADRIYDHGNLGR